MPHQDASELLPAFVHIQERLLPNVVLPERSVLECVGFRAGEGRIACAGSKSLQPNAHLILNRFSIGL
jgi:hypothetical protein